MVMAGAGAASASTFFVNGASGSDGNTCTSASEACKTIKAAVAKSELVPDGVVIYVGAGEYAETLALESYGDTNLAIIGAGSGVGGTTIVGADGTPTIRGAPLNTGTTTIANMRIVNPPSDASSAVEFVETPVALNDVSVDMQDAASAATALVVKGAVANMNAVSVGGAWTGLALHQEGGGNITNSTFVAKGAAIQLAAGLPYGGDDVFIENSKVQAGTTGGVGIETSAVDLIVDSSLLLGGSPYGIEWLHPLQRQRVMTIVGSTIDAGELGVSDPTVKDVYADVNSGPGAYGFINIVGSILLEPQAALVGGAQDHLTLGCAHSDVPSQIQAGDGTTTGAIECAGGPNGNVSSSPASLFLDPGSNYQLLPGSPAIDAVPSGTISLPFGLTPSATDLAGNPRVVDGDGNCLAVQDMGAFELQGHAAACPKPVVPCACPAIRSAPKLTSLRISPSSFRAAPRGATIASRRHKKSRYGTSISYRDSQAATATFFVGTESHGGCASSEANTAAHCYILHKRSFGWFTHNDRAGANSFHFSGRVRGKRLPTGRYILEGYARNRAGRGPIVIKEFTIKG
jgi:hypothetical protein